MTHNNSLTMAYPGERYHIGSEYGAVAHSYIVSEVESPHPWRDEIDEDGLNVEEIFIAPPGSRRPEGYARRSTYHGMKNRNWPRAPPPTPSNLYPDAEHEVHHHHEEAYAYPPTYRAKGVYHSRSGPPPPPLSDSSSICSVSDCDECAYTERSQYRQPQRQQNRRAAAPVPQVIVPRGRIGIGAAPALSPAPQPPAYTHDPPRVFRLQNSTEIEEGIRDNASSVEPFNADLASNASPHNQMVIFEGNGTGQAYSDTSPLHSNVSSPRWSMANQRYISGSEGYSDKSQSPAISFDRRNLYEQPDPRFGYHGQPPRVRGLPPPVVITRSSDSNEIQRPRYGYGGSEDGSDRSSDSGYCSSGSSSGGAYDRRRYW